jgi:DNA-binding response OmpR family regulator
MPELEDKGESFCRRVLCIDHDWDLLKLEKVILETSGYEVLIANDGTEAMNLVKGGRVDLVVLTAEMPAKTGADLAERLRMRQPTLPIIMVSGVATPKRFTKTADRYIPKAKIVMTLGREVKRLLGNKQPLSTPTTSLKPVD